MWRILWDLDAALRTVSGYKQEGVFVTNRSEDPPAREAKKDLFQLCGAWPGLDISAQVLPGVTRLVADHEIFDDPMRIDLAHESQTVVFQYLALKMPYRGKGIGTRMVYRLLTAAKRLGYDAVITTALQTIGRARSFNGSYTVARLGFDTALPEEYRQLFPGASTAIAAVSTAAGREAWRNNAISLDEVVFNLSDGSPSWLALNKYLEWKLPWKNRTKAMRNT